MGRTAQVSGVAPFVGVQRTVQNNGNVKSEPKYLAVKNLQYVLSTLELCLVLLLLSWLLRWADFFAFFFFLRVASHQLHSVCVYCEGPAVLSSPSSVVRHQKTLSRHRHVMHVSDILPRCECKLTFRARPQIDIPKCDQHVHCENRSLIQSLALMHSAKMPTC